MAYSSKTININQFAGEFTLRNDVGRAFYIAQQTSMDRVRFGDIFEIVDNDGVNASEIENFYYVEIGNVSSLGEVSPVFLSWEDRNELNENYFKKIEKGDIIKAQEGDILVSKVRPNLKKFIYIDKTTATYYYTSAFIHLLPRMQNRLMYYGLRTSFFKDIMAISRQGKGYPTVNDTDLPYASFSKNEVMSLIDSSPRLVKDVEKITAEISKIQSEIKSESEIINTTICNTLLISRDILLRLDNTKTINKPVSEMAFGNLTLRSGYRWAKLQVILNEIKRQFGEYIYLGDCLLGEKTKNGWSPECSENEGETKVLGIDSINKDGKLTYGNPKFTNETRKDIDKFIIKCGDFFVSRGNTVDLVALASIADTPDDIYIYPDIMIRLNVNEEVINKTFLAYYINSIVGRLYFKYSAKGKQQTMVKVSSEEIENLIVPKISLDIQNDIVNKIQFGLKKRAELINNGHSLRTQLDSLFLTCMKSI